jgi:ketosteroid isomerase-like protein
MSEENVEIVRRSIDGFNAFMRGELSREALGRMGDPEYEFRWHDDRTMPDLPQDLPGTTASLGFVEQMRSVWEGLTMEPLEINETPDGRVVTVTRLSGRGRESGVPFESHFFQLWTIRDGKPRKVELFRHRADALEAAGLRE